MIVCIIAGGSGTRLWPLSTPDFPKHLLSVNGDSSSLLQNTYKRAQKISQEIYIITEKSHSHHVKEQLPELADDKFIIEPGRRGTASCIIAALAKISDKHDSSEAIAILSADHYIRDVEGFKHSFKVAGDVSEKEGRIVLVGVEPDHPATGFGYIQKDGIYSDDSFAYNVHSFKEKPDYNTARQYVKSGKYLWNCGYFVGSIDTFANKMAEKAKDLNDSFNILKKAVAESEFEEKYLALESDTIDYALIEKLDDLLVVPASFDWMDLGSFGDLHAAVGADENGNYVGKEMNVELEDMENSYIENHEDKPVAVIGLDNVVVVNTKNGLLVARKDLGQKVGDVAKRIIKKQEK